MRGETVWRVPPLTLPCSPREAAIDPPAEHEALRLFVDRAAAVRPGFAATPENWARSCSYAGRWMAFPSQSSLPPRASAPCRPNRSRPGSATGSGRPASGHRTAPRRQQTLLATVDWSFDLLTPDEQVLLRRLVVFSRVEPGDGRGGLR